MSSLESLRLEEIDDTYWAKDISREYYADVLRGILAPEADGPRPGLPPMPNRTVVPKRKREVRVPLGGSDYARIDASDHKLVKQYKWCKHRDKRTGLTYAKTKVDGKTVYMHRLILGVTDPTKVILHCPNPDGTDNRRCNIRVGTQQENVRNNRPHDGRKYKGVFRRPNSGRVYVTICNQNVPTPNDIHEGAIRYNEEAYKRGWKTQDLNVVDFWDLPRWAQNEVMFRFTPHPWIVFRWDYRKGGHHRRIVRS